MTDNNVLLSPSEAAELLNVSPVTLRQWSQKGRIPFQITPGGHRRYKKSELYWQIYWEVKVFWLDDTDRQTDRLNRLYNGNPFLDETV